MTDQSHSEFMARYFADMKEESRKQLAAAADLIARFTVMAESKGVSSALSRSSTSKPPELSLRRKALLGSF
nr:hypothetical protein [Pseudomonas aeruginosa]